MVGVGPHADADEDRLKLRQAVEIAKEDGRGHVVDRHLHADLPALLLEQLLHLLARLVTRRRRVLEGEPLPVFHLDPIRIHLPARALQQGPRLMSDRSTTWHRQPVFSYPLDLRGVVTDMPRKDRERVPQRYDSLVDYP